MLAFIFPTVDDVLGQEKDFFKIFMLNSFGLRLVYGNHHFIARVFNRFFGDSTNSYVGDVPEIWRFPGSSRITPLISTILFPVQYDKAPNEVNPSIFVLKEPPGSWVAFSLDMFFQPNPTQISPSALITSFISQ